MTFNYFYYFFFSNTDRFIVFITLTHKESFNIDLIGKKIMEIETIKKVTLNLVQRLSFIT